MATQGANNGPGQGAGNQFVKFTRASAQRIASVVRTVEGGDRRQAPITFDHPIIQPGSAIRTGTFTGYWGRQQTAVVTFVYGSTATASVHNDLINLPNSGTRYCVVGREGTAWRLINWQWEIAYAPTAAELTTTALVFKTLPVGAVSTASTITFNISVASCSTT